ncbi:MAG: hypothetical protein U0800_05790 [Isosphaeraceae bacterium]
MAKPIGRRPPGDSGEIADAASFFREQQPGDEDKNTRTAQDHGEYELLDMPSEPSRPGPTIGPEPRTEGPLTRAERAPDREEAPRTYQEEDEEVVDRVWTRWGEWGPTILLLSAIGAAWLFVLYITLDADQIGRTFFLFILGVAAIGICSYPILITLERPVRVTPEQALQDYFGALNHWLPQYRRMWLLLASPRQDSPPLYDVGALRAFWKARIDKLRAEHNLPRGPVFFAISGYKSEKSAGKTALVAKYNVDVRGSDDPSTPPLATYADSQSLVRGPDRMWYLTKARMPEQPKTAAPRKDRDRFAEDA